MFIWNYDLIGSWICYKRKLTKLDVDKASVYDWGMIVIDESDDQCSLCTNRLPHLAFL